MNIFERKLKESKAAALPIHPLELYQTCPFRPGYEYPRISQGEVLKAWHDVRGQRDVICKMNTGSGKTLTGLMMLYSKMVELRLPSLYLCPDNHLVEQTVTQAALYGIPVCTFETNDIPADFLNSRKILVCNFSKLFNGRSKFNRPNMQIGAIVIDDAHKCVDISREQSSLKLSQSHPISKRLLSLFEADLRRELPGTFTRIKDGDPYVSMRVPYWTWLDREQEIIGIINEESSKIDAEFKSGKQKTIDTTPLKWSVMADNLRGYDCYMAGKHIEIVPIHVPYDFFAPFNEAKHRYILSATFEDDFDLIKDLGIDIESIKQPIFTSNQKDIGKRLILAPSRFDAKILDNEMRDFIAKYPKAGYNVVVLVPSWEQTRQWEKKGAVVVTSETIKESIEKLESSKGNFMVLANRYDGIDLAADACRVLVLDGLPLFSSLQEQYSEDRLESVRAGRKAQIIEQGLGRGVRSGGDHCVVFLMGADLLEFLAEDRNLEHFTPVTFAQLQLGLELLEGVETENSIKTIAETAELGLKEDSKWIDYHTQKMLEVPPDHLDDKKMKRLTLANIEKKAISEFRLRKYATAGNVIMTEINNAMELTNKEKAWYHQFAAQLMYLGDKGKSNEIQAHACVCSNKMLHPPSGHDYNKAVSRGVQPSLLRKRLSEFNRPQDILTHINSILSDLIYSPELDANKFEKALDRLGDFLGFDAQMPESETGRGPDNLWMLCDGHALILEAKSCRTGDEISKGNIEQLLHSREWFQRMYGKDAPFTAVTLQPNGKRNQHVEINGQMVMDQAQLDLLHKAMIEFGTSLQTINPKAIAEEDVSKRLVSYKLTPALFRQTYIKPIK